MTKIDLGSGVIQYMFPPSKTENHYGYNIIAIVDNDEAILIDTAFEEQAQQVFEDFSVQGISIKGVVISHFHDDHMQGLKVLPKVPVYGSYRFQETLGMWTPKEEHENYTPSVIVKEPITIKLGSHTLEIIPSSGHSVCTVLVKIDEQFLHVADEIIYSNDGQPILPSIESRENIKRQLESWERIRNHLPLAIIPAHGPVLRGIKLQRGLKNCQAFAEAILAAGDDSITYEEATKNCDCIFLHVDWFSHLSESE